ncbi:MAG: BCD family MFS transporter, partial [Rhodocyclaceae bacterium]|nr:BCD family MFS transporter [Rhodocyclaceae bacterium]
MINPFRRDARQMWLRISPRLLPFADAASADLPLARLLRLSLFQVSVGMVTALLVGTLNRIMIVELGVGAWLVSLMVAVPLLAAPFRALIGFKSDVHRSVLGWRRVPYIWFGTILQFGGLAIMPFALILLSGDTHWPAWFAKVAAALAFLLVGMGVQTTQTAGLALATDLAAEKTRPRVVALMYTMLLVGMVASGIAFGLLLSDFSQVKLVKVVQGAATLTLVLNLFALWKQEPRRPHLTHPALARPGFGESWKTFSANPSTARFLVALGLGTAAFNMQDIVLEPYGAEILGLSVGETSALTALMAGGALVAFMAAARLLARGFNANRIAAAGLVCGLWAFAAVIFADPLDSAALFRVGVALIGFGGGLFSVGTLTTAMSLEESGLTGMALGAWGAVQATCMGGAIAIGGALRDWVSAVATTGVLGEAMNHPSTGYGTV